MATCKIMRRNFSMKIGLPKEVRSAKDRRALANNKEEVASKSASAILGPSFSFPRRGESSSHNWNDLSQTKLPREKNRGPLRTMRSAMYSAAKPAQIVAAVSNAKITPNTSLTNTIKRVFGPSNTNMAPSTGGRPGGEDVLSQRGALATLAANRRLLKSSTGLKILLNRRFGSSASSSCGSLFRRHDDRRRVSSFKRTFKGGFAAGAFASQASSNDLTSHKCLQTFRNQNMSQPLGCVSQAVQVSSKIQQELMPIDKSLRERISLKNTYASTSISKAQQNDTKESAEPMDRWHQPPTPYMLSTRLLERLSERRPVASMSDKTQEVRMHAPNRKRRLDMQCKPMSQSSPTIGSGSSTGVASPSLNKKSASLPQQCTALTCESGGIGNDSVSLPRQMAYLTARRLTTVDQQPIRRFSLRRPPKTSLTEITTPAPGPAAESLLQQHHRARTITPIAFTHNQSRYSRLTTNSRVAQKSVSSKEK